MNSSVKGNRNLVQNKKSLREIAKDYKPADDKNPLLYQNTMNAEEYANFKQELIRKREKGKKQFVVLVVFVVLAIIISLVYMSSN